MSADSQPEVHTFTMNDTLPRLAHATPYCDHCGNGVQFEDDYAFCDTCRVVWDDTSEGSVAEADPDFYEGASVPCEIVHGVQREPWDHGGKRYASGPPQPCILPSGHEGTHLCPRETTVTAL